MACSWLKKSKAACFFVYVHHYRRHDHAIDSVSNKDGIEKITLRNYGIFDSSRMYALAG